MVQNVSMHASESQLGCFFSILWGLWVDRCRIAFEGGVFQPQGSVAWALKLMYEYQKYHPPKSFEKRRKSVEWCPPKQGSVKINTDGAFDWDSEKGGLGVVVRDWLGDVLLAKSRHVPNG